MDQQISEMLWAVMTGLQRQHSYMASGQACCWHATWLISQSWLLTGMGWIMHQNDKKLMGQQALSPGQEDRGRARYVSHSHLCSCYIRRTLLLLRASRQLPLTIPFRAWSRKALNHGRSLTRQNVNANFWTLEQCLLVLTSDFGLLLQ